MSADCGPLYFCQTCGVWRCEFPDQTLTGDIRYVKICPECQHKFFYSLQDTQKRKAQYAHLAHLPDA
jgi:hypothetical protein